jgi:O-antigen/teichoic acid export membrane protein
MNVDGHDTELTNDAAQLAKGASFTFVTKVVGKGVHVISQIVLARVLGPSLFGIYAIGWTIMRMAGLVAPLGLDKAIVRYASKYWGTDPSRLRGVVQQSIIIAFSSGLSMGLVFFLASHFLANSVFEKPELEVVIRIVSVSFSIIAVVKVLSEALRVAQKFKLASLTEDIGQPAANLLLVGVFSFFYLGLVGAVIAAVCSYGFALLLGVGFSRSTYRNALPDHAKSTYLPFRDLMHFSLLSSFAAVSTMFSQWLDGVFMGVYRAAHEVGIYQTASQVSILFVIILSTVSSVCAPMIARLYHENEMKRLDELFRISTKWVLYCSVPFFLTICFASKEIMLFFYGNQYVDGAVPLVILAVGQLINVGTGPVGMLLIMTGNQKRWFTVSASALLLNIILNILLVPEYGMTGAALATSISVGSLFLYGLIIVNSIMGIWPYDFRFLKGAVATVGSVLVLLIIRLVLSTGAAITLGFLFVSSLISFLTILKLVKFDPEDKEFIHLIKKKLFMTLTR